jgi:sigma-E factor negative regulatory protein RseA
MTEEEANLKEKLCLLLDGELSPSESLKWLYRIENDPTVQAQWVRYSLISEAMRSGRVPLPDSQFVDRISAALANEPTVLAPRAERLRLRERVVTGALAASLGLIGILVAKSLNEYSPMRGADFPVLADVMGASAQSSPAIDSEFRDYLVTHYETAYLAGAQGMLPSVRLVSTESSR